MWLQVHLQADPQFLGLECMDNALICYDNTMELYAWMCTLDLCALHYQSTATKSGH